MTIEQLRKVYLAHPFQPFSIHLADGRSFKIPHREFISHTPSGRTLVVYCEGDDAFDILDPVHALDSKCIPPSLQDKTANSASKPATTDE